MQQDKEEANLAYNRILSWYTSAIYIYIYNGNARSNEKCSLFVHCVIFIVIFQVMIANSGIV